MGLGEQDVLQFRGFDETATPRELRHVDGATDLRTVAARDDAPVLHVDPVDRDDVVRHAACFVDEELRDDEVAAVLDGRVAGEHARGEFALRQPVPHDVRLEGGCRRELVVCVRREVGGDGDVRVRADARDDDDDGEEAEADFAR